MLVHWFAFLRASRGLWRKNVTLQHEFLEQLNWWKNQIHDNGIEVPLGLLLFNQSSSLCRFVCFQRDEDNWLWWYSVRMNVARLHPVIIWWRIENSRRLFCVRLFQSKCMPDSRDPFPCQDACRFFPCECNSRFLSFLSNESKWIKDAKIIGREERDALQAAWRGFFGNRNVWEGIWLIDSISQ